MHHESSQPSLFQQMARFIKRIEEGFRWLDEHPDAVTRFERDVRHRQREDDAWRYLFDRVNGVTALSMQIGLVAEQRLGNTRRGETVSLLLRDALADSKLLAELRHAIARAPASVAHRDQLLMGLELFESGRDHVAVPLLIQAIEGVLWAEAEREGLIERDARGKWQTTARTSRAGRQLDGLESVLALSELPLDEKFARFLRAVVYGGDGNAFRHGTAGGGWSLRVSFLVVALIGWLEIHGLIDSHDAMHHAFLRAQERRQPGR